MASKHKDAIPDSTRRAARPPQKIKHPKVPRSPTQPRTSSKGTGAAPVGALQRVPNIVRSQSNGGKQYKGG